MSRKRKRNPSIHTYSSEYLLINVRGSEVMCGICLCLTLYNGQMIYLTAYGILKLKLITQERSLCIFGMLMSCNL